MRHPAWLIALAASVLLIAACGDEDDGGGSDGGTDAPAAGDPTRLAFYDWEPNVIANPNAREGAETETPFARRDLAQGALEAARECDGGGCILVAEENPEGSGLCPDPGGGFYVLRDRPALTGADIENPEVVSYPEIGGPMVAFEFSERGREEFAAITRAAAERGQADAAESVAQGAALKEDPATAPNYSNHFAVVLDDCIVSRPIVNFAENPNGIDGRAGASIGGGFTTAEAKELVIVLKSDN